MPTLIENAKEIVAANACFQVYERAGKNAFYRDMTQAERDLHVDEKINKMSNVELLELISEALSRE